MTPYNKYAESAVEFHGRFQTSKKPRRVRCVSSEKNPNHFLPGRTPGWLLLPLRGNSPSVPGRKYISGCKCGASRSESNGTIASGNCSIMYGICSPMANKLCAQQTAKTGGKARRGFSTSSKGCGKTRILSVIWPQSQPFYKPCAGSFPPHRPPFGHRPDRPFPGMPYPS